MTETAIVDPREKSMAIEKRVYSIGNCTHSPRSGRSLFVVIFLFLHFFHKTENELHRSCATSARWPGHRVISCSSISERSINKINITFRQCFIIFLWAVASVCVSACLPACNILPIFPSSFFSYHILLERACFIPELAHAKRTE